MPLPPVTWLPRPGRSATAHAVLSSSRCAGRSSGISAWRPGDSLDWWLKHTRSESSGTFLPHLRHQQDQRQHAAMNVARNARNRAGSRHSIEHVSFAADNDVAARGRSRQNCWNSRCVSVWSNVLRQEMRQLCGREGVYRQKCRSQARKRRVSIRYFRTL